MAANGRITVELRGDTPVVVLTGEFDLSNAADLNNALTAVSNGHRRVVIDMTATTFLDSTSLGVLALASRDGTELSVRGASGVARLVLEASGLLSYLGEDA